MGRCSLHSITTSPAEPEIRLELARASRLWIAHSSDGRETWPWVRDSETGAFAEEQKDKDWTHEEYSYPSLVQDASGKITLAYTYNREAIKVVRFDEEWIKQRCTEGKFKGDGPR